MNGQTTFSWSNMAQQNVPPGTSGYYSTTLTPTYNPLTGSCATNYCHGGAFRAGVIGTDPTPTWTDGTYLANPASALISTDCNKCHLSPTSIAKYDHTGISVGAGNCSACHGHDGAGATHIDGTLYGAGTCDSCHSYDLDTTGDLGMSPKAIEGWGAHAVHISHLKTVSV